MTKIFKLFLIGFSVLITANCSQVLQTVELRLDIEDVSSQEEFNVVEKVLTLKEAENL